MIIEGVDLARHAALLEAASSDWEILTLSPHEALAQPIEQEPLDAILMVGGDMPEEWHARWDRSGGRPLRIRLSDEVPGACRC